MGQMREIKTPEFKKFYFLARWVTLLLLYAPQVIATPDIEVVQLAQHYQASRGSTYPLRRREMWN